MSESVWDELLRLREENRRLNEALDGLEAKLDGPIGDGGKGLDGEDKIYWCREVRSQCLEWLREARAAIQGGDK